MAFDARVLILAAGDGRIGPLAAGLDALGWTTVTARDVVSAEMTLQDFPLEAAVIDINTFDADVASRLRAAAEPRRLPIMVIGTRPDSVKGADLTMSTPPHPAQAALRLEQLGRAAIAEEEYRLRVTTFATRGVGLDERTDDDGPLRVLAAGVAEDAPLPTADDVAALDADPVRAFDAAGSAAMVAEVSASSVRPEAKSERISASGPSGMVKAPDCDRLDIRRFTASPSRPMASNSKRSKFEDTWMSIDGVAVGITVPVE